MSRYRKHQHAHSQALNEIVKMKKMTQRQAVKSFHKLSDESEEKQHMDYLIDLVADPI